MVCLEDYPIHTVTGLVKQWLRELPDPLMTFMHYNDFLHAVGEISPFSGTLSQHTQHSVGNCVCVIEMMSFPLLTDLPEKQEQLHAIYKVLEELPPANFNTLERLIFHLVR